MKLFFLLIFLPLLSFSQKVVDNRIDEFTHHAVKRTEYKLLIMDSKTTVYFSIRKVDSLYAMDFKMRVGNGHVFSISKGDELMFKLSTDSILTLKCLESVISCAGCGAKGLIESTAQGVTAIYIITKDQFEEITQHPPVKFRVYTNSGYTEDNLSTAKVKTLIEAIKNITEDD